MSDRSSRKTLAMSAAVVAVTFGVAALRGIATGGIGSTWAGAALIFLAQIGYEGRGPGARHI